MRSYLKLELKSFPFLEMKSCSLLLLEPRCQRGKTIMREYVSVKRRNTCLPLTCSLREFNSIQFFFEKSLFEGGYDSSLC